jgi:hypothetical protein
MDELLVSVAVKPTAYLPTWLCVGVQENVALTVFPVTVRNVEFAGRLTADNARIWLMLAPEAFTWKTRRE